MTVINLRSFLIIFLISDLFDKMMNLQVIASEDFRRRGLGTICHLRNQRLHNLDLHPGHGFVNDLVSLRLAVELGCILKYSVCTEYSYLVHKPVVVHSLTSLKVRISGPFSPNPHWVYVEAIVVECLESPWILNGDIALSWSTQKKLKVHSHEEPRQSVYRDILSWERVQIERSQWETFGGVFLERGFHSPLLLSPDECDDSDVDSGAEV